MQALATVLSGLPANVDLQNVRGSGRVGAHIHSDFCVLARLRACGGRRSLDRVQYTLASDSGMEGSFHVHLAGAAPRLFLTYD